MRVLALLGLLVCPGCAMRSWLRPSVLPEGGREVRDLAYYEGEGFDEKKHRLDVYAPKGPGPYPVVVFVHGGGWIFGDRQQPGGNYVQLGRRLAGQGVVAVVPSYRLGPSSRHPSQIHDVARALAWALKHAPEYGGDAGAVFAMGHSAGAHLVALAACDPRWLEHEGVSAAQLAGIIAISGPYDVEHLGRSLFIGGLPMVIPAFGADPRVWREAGPMSHLTAGRPPPFFVAWAAGDVEVLRRDGRRFTEALRAAEVPVEAFETPYDDHLSIITDFGDDDALSRQALDFVRRNRRAVQQRAALTP